MQLYDAKRYRDALQVFLLYAQRGDASAQAMVGNIFYDGLGVFRESDNTFGARSNDLWRVASHVNLAQGA